MNLNNNQWKKYDTTLLNIYELCTLYEEYIDTDVKNFIVYLFQNEIDLAMIDFYHNFLNTKIKEIYEIELNFEFEKNLAKGSFISPKVSNNCITEEYLEKTHGMYKQILDGKKKNRNNLNILMAQNLHTTSIVAVKYQMKWAFQIIHTIRSDEFFHPHLTRYYSEEETEDKF